VTPSSLGKRSQATLEKIYELNRADGAYEYAQKLRKRFQDGWGFEAPSVLRP
jgi:hypothetical protein